MSTEELQDVVSRSKNYWDVLKNLGYSKQSGAMYKLLKFRVEKDGIDTSHFKLSKPFKFYSMSEILVENSPYTNISKLKGRLVKEGILEYKCSVCGNTGEWNGKPLSLQLHHKNGKHFDHRVENLCFLCPNCHSQTDNFAGKNNGNYANVA